MRMYSYTRRYYSKIRATCTYMKATYLALSRLSVIASADRRARTQMYICLSQACKPVSSQPTSSLTALVDWLVSRGRLTYRSTWLWTRDVVRLFLQRWRCGSQVQSGGRQLAFIAG